MAQSNTKLDKFHKNLLPELRAENPRVQVAHFKHLRITIAYTRGLNATKFATSVASPDEKKFRRKLGEYNAVTRLVWEDKYAVLPDCFFERMLMDMEDEDSDISFYLANR